MNIFRILVVSDSHGDFSSLLKVWRKENQLNPVQLLMHLGDGVLDALRLHRMTGISLEAVNGNNDPKGAFPDETIVTIEKVRIYLSHGNQFGLPLNPLSIARRLRGKKIDLALFGHTHQYIYEQKKGLTIVNPGAACRWEKNPGYIILKITAGKFELTRKAL